MCGIIGYIGNEIVEKKLLSGLKKLEYRGYDSSGILTICHNKFTITKQIGKVDELDKKITHYNTTCCGIGHTRWATHGKVCLENAHPHTSQNNIWGIVHNGVIENYKELQSEYLSNYTFYGNTDSEIIANMLENNTKTALNSQQEAINILIDTCSQLKGSYSLVCANNNFTNHLFLAKNKSPLYIATNGIETTTASDIVCFDNNYKEYYELLDNEFCYCNNKNIVFFNKNKQIINKKTVKLNKIETNSYLHKFPSYMLKEINEIPFAMQNIVNKYSKHSIFKNISLNNINKIVLIGCGTAFHACEIGKKYFKQSCNINVESYIASEFNCAKNHIDSNTLCIFVSQSGETFDTLKALYQCKRKGGKIVAITNVEHSTMSKKAKVVLPICAGEEIAVASTKAYNCQLLILYLLCTFLTNNDLYDKKLSQIKSLIKTSKKVLSLNYDNLLEKISSTNDLVLLGKHFDYITAKEACLKIKEITYINAQVYPSGELKHGYIALINNSTTVINFLTNKSLIAKTLIACSEIKARGGKTILITTLNIKKDNLNNIDLLFQLPSTNLIFAPIISIIPIQIISESISRNLNHDPDKPRNLAKSVTVE